MKMKENYVNNTIDPFRSYMLNEKAEKPGETQTKLNKLAGPIIRVPYFFSIMEVYVFSATSYLPQANLIHVFL